MFPMTQNIFPLTVADPAITGKFKELLYEIVLKYGKDVNLTLVADMVPPKELIKISPEEGIAVNDLLLNLTILAQSASTKDKLVEAVTFTMDLGLSLNFTLSNFKAYLNVPKIGATNAKVTNDNVGVYARNYNDLFTSVFEDQVGMINAMTDGGYDLANLNENIYFLEGMFTNTTVTAYQEPGYIWAGFTYFTDGMMAEEVTKTNSFFQ